MKIINKAKGFITSFSAHWKTPPEGRYMSNREILSLSFGGIGVRFIVYCVSNMIIAIGNTLIGNTIGINPGALYIIYILGILSSFPLTALRARMIDNTRSMKGKYRPYILSMGIPTVILGIGFIWMPYERMSLIWKCVAVLLFNVGFQFFYNFMNDSYNSIINVLSPNTIERSDVLSIKAIVENFAPSIASIFLPLVAKLITGQNTLYDLKIYRVVYPPLLIVGFLISLLVYANTEEKIVQAKTHVIQIKFIDAFKAIAQNKYFWIISFASWLGFLESSFNSILGWIYNYQNAATAGQYSIITAIGGNAAFWAFLLAPFFIRKFGKRTVLISTNLLNIVFILCMLPIVRMTGSPVTIWLLLASTFANSICTAMCSVVTTSIDGDIRDYQQYKTGERIDGMFATVGLIGSVITLATSSVLPAIYERSGLNTSTAIALGYDGSNVYDVLYNQEYFIRICSVLVIASVVGAVLNVIPYFFYDLTEAKQRAIVNVLKIRALFEDYANNVLSDEALAEAIDIINEANEYAGREIDRSAKSKEKKEENAKIYSSKLVIAELNRFETAEGKADLELARAMVGAGLNGFMNAVTLSKQDAKAMPKSTEEQKERRKNTIRLIKDIESAKKAIGKYFPEGVIEFDSGIFDELFRAEDNIELEFAKTLKAEKLAKESKDKAKVSELKAQVKALQNKKREIQLLIKKANEENTKYYRATKPYTDAKRIVAQSENYSRYNDIIALYQEAKKAECLKQAAEGNHE